MKNFKYDTIVKFINTNSSLDDTIGFIKGIAQDFGDYKHYIVSCEEPIKDDFTSIAITEYCLEEMLAPARREEILKWWKDEAKDKTIREIAIDHKLNSLDGEISIRKKLIEKETNDPIEKEIKLYSDKVGKEVLIVLAEIKEFLKSKLK